jgi:hypothetical protein
MRCKQVAVREQHVDERLGFGVDLSLNKIRPQSTANKKCLTSERRQTRNEEKKTGTICASVFFPFRDADWTSRWIGQSVARGGGAGDNCNGCRTCRRTYVRFASS